MVISIGIIVRRRCPSAGSVAAAMAFARSTVPMRVRQESASMRGPGTAPSGASWPSRRQLLQAEFERGKLIEMAVHGRDDVDEAQGCERSALPGDREHQPRHDDRGGAVRTTASNCCAGTAPLRWDRGAIRRGEAGDHALCRPFGVMSKSSAVSMPQSRLYASFHTRDVKAARL